MLPTRLRFPSCAILQEPCGSKPQPGLDVPPGQVRLPWVPSAAVPQLGVGQSCCSLWLHGAPTETLPPTRGSAKPVVRGAGMEGGGFKECLELQVTFGDI